MKSMMRKIPGCHRFNCSLTNEVIKYHDRGYELDFNIANDMSLICIQDNALFKKTEVFVNVAGQVFDFSDHCYKYVHLVETASGMRGLLIIAGIYGCLNSRYSSVRDNYDSMRKIA